MKFPSENFISTSEIFLVLIDMLQCIHMVLTDRITLQCIQEEEAHFGKKRKFKDQKSFSFADFHDGATMVSTEWKLESHVKQLQKRY